MVRLKMAAMCGAASALLAVSAGQAWAEPEPAPRTNVAQGVLAGTIDNGVSAFFGAPYAAAPAGDRRWTAPAAASVWTGVRDASAFGPSCPQTLTPDGFMMWTPEYMAPAAPGVAEDCLSANVWTPANFTNRRPDQHGLPVLVYIHGGAYTSGSGSVPIYNGANIARQGVVVVTINYRLGALGFIAHPELSAEQGGGSGNYGIQDQIAALRWVRDNIAAFGGDPTQVTIAGQSAGGGSVLAVLSAPSARGLFRAAMVLSSPGTAPFMPLEVAEAAGTTRVSGWGASSIEAARALPLETVLANAPGVGGGPVRDGVTIPASSAPPPLASDVPVMIGYTLNDLFAATRRVTAAEWQDEAATRYGDQAAAFLSAYPGGTDTQASASATRESSDRAQMAPLVTWLDTRGARSPVYAYLFSHVEPGPQSAQYGAFHSSELPYMFDTLHLSPGRDFTAVDRAVVHQFSGAILNFVRTGDPNGPQIPAWPVLTTDGKAVMEFGDTAVLSRVYPEGSDAVMAAGQAPRQGGPFSPPAD